MRLYELGRRRLAMRLPDVRDSIMRESRSWQLELFEAYQLAVEFREVLRLDPSCQELFEEYEKTCLDLERDVERVMRETTDRARGKARRSNNPTILNEARRVHATRGCGRLRRNIYEMIMQAQGAVVRFMQHVF